MTRYDEVDDNKGRKVGEDGTDICSAGGRI